MDNLITWVIRFLHVAGAAIWVGGFAVLALALLPRLAASPQSEPLRQAAFGGARLLNWAAAITFLAGFALISRTRGFGALMGGEWGGIVIACIVIAFGMGAIVGIVQKRLRGAAAGALAPEDARRAGGLATIGLGLGVLALALMTRALYAPS